jgi:large subunit ribosomal protein L28
MYICDRCQKGLQVGMNVSHAHNRTKKRSLPNLHVLTVKVDGKNKTMRLCTKCTRIIRKQYPFKAEEKSEVKKIENKESSKIASEIAVS